MLVNPPFCPLITCPIRYLSHILQQFHGSPLLLMQSIFSKPPWGLWLRDLSNSIVILGSPSLDLDPFRHTRPTQAPYDHLNTSGPLRHLRPIKHHPRPTQAPQAHLGTLGPLRHPRPIQAHLAHQASPQAHLGTLDPFRLFFTWMHGLHGLHGCIARMACMCLIFYFFYLSIYQFYSFIYLFLENCMSLMIILISFLFIYLLIYFDR